MTPAPADRRMRDPFGGIVQHRRARKPAARLGESRLARRPIRRKTMPFDVKSPMKRRPRIRAYPAVAPYPRRLRDGHDQPGDWEVAIYGDLTDKHGDLLEKLIGLPRGSRGTIFFDSSGGSAYVGLALASTMRLRGLDAIGVVTGECSSAALLPFAACSSRYVTPHSSLLFHPIRWQSDEDVRMEEAAEWARHFRNLEEDLDRLLAQLFNISIEKIREWSRPGRFVSGPEFAAAGLAKVVTLFSEDVWSQIEQERGAARENAASPCDSAES
jgi:ATP-dependent protease ClpP protease subunit